MKIKLKKLTVLMAFFVLALGVITSLSSFSRVFASINGTVNTDTDTDTNGTDTGDSSGGSQQYNPYSWTDTGTIVTDSSGKKTYIPGKSYTHCLNVNQAVKCVPQN